jgi:hypothetical protein
MQSFLGETDERAPSDARFRQAEATGDQPGPATDRS